MTKNDGDKIAVSPLLGHSVLSAGQIEELEKRIGEYAGTVTVTISGDEMAEKTLRMFNAINPY
jgi:hypothetical protein